MKFQTQENRVVDVSRPHLVVVALQVVEELEEA